MRGVVAGGMVTGLEGLKLLHCFDLVVGSSAGACAGAYFLAGQAEYGTTIYFEDINNSNFIDIGRLWRGQPVVDIDFLIDRVMRDTKALDIEAIFATGIDFRIVCTDVDTGSEYIEHVGPPYNSDVLQALRASSKMPLLAGLQPVTLNGHRCMDGGLNSQLPLDVAVEAGATHLLAIATRPMFHPSARNDSITDNIIATALSILINPRLRQPYLRRRARYAATIERLHFATRGNLPQGPALLGMFLPSDKCLIGRTERSATVLRQGARDGAAVVHNVFASVL